MTEETINTKTDAGNVLGIVGLVFGVIALVISFIPCLGIYAIWPGAVAIILSGIGLMFALQKNGAKGLTIAALIISLIGTGIAAYQFTVLNDAVNGLSNIANGATVEYSTCDEVITAYEEAIEQSQELSEEASENILGALSGGANLTVKIANIQAQALKLECNTDEDFNKKLEELDKKYEELNTETQE